MLGKIVKKFVLILATLLIVFANSGTVAAFNKVFLEEQNIRWYTGECFGANTGCGSQLKVATYNVLGKSHTDGPRANSSLPTWSERIVKVKDNIIREKIDVIGFQEFEKDQRDYLEENLDNYERSTHGKESDSIMWNTNRFTKTGQGTWKTTYFGGPIDEPWVKLKDNSSEQEFYFMSLHDPVNNGQGSPAVRYENAKKHLAKIQELQTQAPVIIVGDFNNGYRKNDGSGVSSDNKTAYCVLSKGGMTHGLDSLKNREYKCSGEPRPDKGAGIGSRIDHILMSQGLSATEYYDIPKSQSGSDHVAVIANITISGSCAGSPQGQVKVGQANIKVSAPSETFKNQLDRVVATNPDFVSGNEWSSRSNSAIQRSGYEFYRGTNGGDPSRHTEGLVVMWKSDKWSKTDTGTLAMTLPSDKTYHSAVDAAENYDGKRSIVWVTVEDSTGAKVTFMSLHHMVNPNKYGPKPERKALYKLGMERAIEKIKELQTIGPVIIAGDFNAQSYREPDNTQAWHPKQMLGDANMDATHYGLSERVQAAVDYIFYTKSDIKPISHNIPFQLFDHPYLTATLEFTGGPGAPRSGSSSAASGSCTCEDPSASSGVDIDRLLRAIAQRESGGDPTIENGGDRGGISSASGKYQYIDGTWQARKESYPPSGDYSHAADAPEAIQDAVAYIEYAKKIKDYNGDLVKIAVSHYYPIANTNPDLMDVVPGGGNSLTPRQYADGFKASYESNEGSGIPLKYQEAPDFDRHAGTPVSGGGSDGESADCESDTEGGFTDLDGVSMFYQNKEPWASKAYGIGTIEECGCGPTSLAIAVKTLTGYDTDPKKMADWFVENGGQMGGGSCGSNWIWESRATLFESTYGIKVRSIGSSASSIKTALGEGDSLVLMSQNSNGMFTSGGHLMLARGVNDDNKILVADPNSEEFSKKAAGFTDGEIEAGLRAAWVIKKI